ncbi:UPF0739 protein C1orf74 homolog [Gadus macrocephalus]|uniref:UPF0739 protein C1orf74 homolog n=1 Tax=Gadus macrocephalus TaxID=80720 RepID=UPI0028CB7B02|nr:UPF0739 protein C1orf74 homolog [Gadus macrocephalus]
MSNERPFSVAACKWLSVGKKSIFGSLSIELGVQVLAVDLGLKPALLYDINCATADQVQQYLCTLQSNSLVSKSLITVDINGNVLIVNPDMMMEHLKQLLISSYVSVIDVSHTLEKPHITEPLSGDLRSMLQELMSVLQTHVQSTKKDQPLLVGDEAGKWNLCTLFGILLGFPCTYWFDQGKSFENCLAMTHLMVFKASVSWQTETAGHACCLYSFSTPALLHNETQASLDHWSRGLTERFQQQSVLSNLSITQSHVTLRSVCL